MSGEEVCLNFETGSSSGSGEVSSHDVRDVVASSRMMERDLEFLKRDILQAAGPIPDDIFNIIMQKVGKYMIGWTRRKEVSLLHQVHQAILPMMEDLSRKVVKEEISPALEKFLNTQCLLEPLTERELELKFQNTALPTALLGEVIKGEDGRPLRVALVDKVTGQIVKHGPGASAKVEISLLDSNSRIMTEGDKTKPHFTKSNYVYLNEGAAELCDVKLGHPSKWTKKCSCRLEAKMANNLNGTKVDEALTSLFEVKDGRKKSNEKHYPPHLSSEVWRLVKIDKNGLPCKRLAEEKVETVRDFLFLLWVDPQRLKVIVGDNWKAIMNHAKTCILDDEKIYIYCCPSSSEGVTFNVVGELKGMICDSQYIPIDILSSDEKARAQELLQVASKNREGIESFDDEASLLHKFPCKSSFTTSDADATNCFALVDVTSSPTESQIFSPPTGQLCQMSLGDPDGASSGTFSGLDDLVDYEKMFSEISSNETFRPGSSIYVVRAAFRPGSSIYVVRAVSALSVMLFRSRKRVRALGNVCDNTKRQRIGCV